MSRDRPTEAPEIVRGGERRAKILKPQEVERRSQIERLKRAGPALLAPLFDPFNRGAKAPQFIRRGYEANIPDELRAFYEARPRPWRPASRSSCGPTWKERQKMRRRARA